MFVDGNGGGSSAPRDDDRDVANDDARSDESRDDTRASSDDDDGRADSRSDGADGDRDDTRIGRDDDARSSDDDDDDDASSARPARDEFIDASGDDLFAGASSRHDSGSDSDDTSNSDLATRGDAQRDEADSAPPADGDATGSDDSAEASDADASERETRSAEADDAEAPSSDASTTLDPDVVEALDARVLGDVHLDAAARRFADRLDDAGPIDEPDADSERAATMAHVLDEGDANRVADLLSPTHEDDHDVVASALRDGYAQLAQTEGPDDARATIEAVLAPENFGAPSSPEGAIYQPDAALAMGDPRNIAQLVADSGSASLQQVAALSLAESAQSATAATANDDDRAVDSAQFADAALLSAAGDSRVAAGLVSTGQLDASLLDAASPEAAATLLDALNAHQEESTFFATQPDGTVERAWTYTGDLDAMDDIFSAAAEATNDNRDAALDGALETYAVSNAHRSDVAREALVDDLLAGGVDASADALGHYLTGGDAPTLGTSDAAGQLMADLVHRGSEAEFDAVVDLISVASHRGPEDRTGLHQATASALGSAYDQALIDSDQAVALVTHPISYDGYTETDITQRAHLIGASGSSALQQDASATLHDRWRDTGTPELAYAAAHAAGDHFEAVSNLVQRNPGTLSALIDTLSPERLIENMGASDAIEVRPDNLNALGNLFETLAVAPASPDTDALPVGNQAFLEALDHLSGTKHYDQSLRDGMGAYLAEHRSTVLEPLGNTMRDQSTSGLEKRLARQRMLNLSSGLAYGETEYAEAVVTVLSERTLALKEEFEASGWSDDQVALELGFVVGGFVSGRVMNRAYSDTAATNETLATFGILLAKNGGMEAAQRLVGEIPVVGGVLDGIIDMTASVLLDGLEDWTNQEFEAGRLSAEDAAIAEDLHLAQANIDLARHGIPSDADATITDLIDEQIDEMLRLAGSEIPSGHPNRDELDRLIGDIDASGH